MKCCDEYGNCRQGRDCPARNAAEAATEVGADESASPPATSLLVVATLIVVLIVVGILIH